MSTTTNVQSFLPYIFRPIYTYNSLNGFGTTFNIRNIDNITASSLSVTTLRIGDDNNNVYVGTSSGNAAALMSTCNALKTTMIGISAGSGQSNTSNVECIGYSTGYNIHVVSNSSFIGALSGSNSSNVLNTIVVGTDSLRSVTAASNVIAIGVGTANGPSSNGGSNIYIGNSNNTIGLTGTGNIIIGHAVAPPSYSVGGVSSNIPSTISNKLFIGSGSNILIAGDFVSGCVSIGTTNTTPNSLNAPYYNPILPTGAQIQLDVAKYVRIGYGLGIGIDPGNYAMDVNGQFHVADGAGGDLLFAPPVYNSSNGALTLKSTAVGGTMSLNVVGTTQSSGYCTFQGTTAAFGNGIVSNVATLTTTGMVNVTVRNATGVMYSAPFLVSNATTGTFTFASTPLSNVGLTYGVSIINGGVTISNTSAGSVTFTYNVMVYPC